MDSLDQIVVLLSFKMKELSKSCISYETQSNSLIL